MAKVNIKTDDKCAIPDMRFQSDLEFLLNESENAYYFESILNSALYSLYQLLPNGEEHYGRKDPKIGHVRLTSCTDFDEGPHALEIKYSPSDFYQNRLGYLNTLVGSINIQKRTYNLPWVNNQKEDSATVIFPEKKYELPIILMNDTVKVMKLLGLTKERKSKASKEV